MARINRDAAEQLIELLDVQSDDKKSRAGKNVVRQVTANLEVGFGPAVAIQLLLHRVAAASVSGSMSRRKWCIKRRPATPTRCAAVGSDLRYGSLERLPFANETFDKAIAINSMQAWPDARGGLRQIQRVLKRSGNFALGFTANSGQPKEEVAESLATAGFAQIRIVDRSKLFCVIAL